MVLIQHIVEQLDELVTTNNNNWTKWFHIDNVADRIPRRTQNGHRHPILLVDGRNYCLQLDEYETENRFVCIGGILLI